MLQFYLLSVTVNLIMGLILVLFDRKNKDGDEDVKYKFLREPAFLLALTIFAGIVSILKLLSPVGVNAIPVLGDFIPFAAGLCGFFVFLRKYLKTLSNSSAVENPFFAFFENYENIIGFACLASAVTHMLFPNVIFL